MKTGFWKSIITATLLVVASLVNAAEPIKIGSFLTVTGPASFLGDPELKTLQMYVEDINAKGGIKGRKIELIHYDTGGKAQDAVSFVKRLIQSDKVDLIVGGTTTGDTMAVIPDVEKEGIPFISMAGAVEIIEPVKPWVFKTPHTDRMAAAKIFEDIRKRGFTKVALISGDGGFDKSGRAQVLKLAPEYGMTLVADESYGNKDTDMTTQLTKIRASGAEVIINFGLGQAPAIVTKNIKQLGIALPVYQSHGVASKTFIDLAGDAAEGVRLPAAALVVAEQLPDTDPQKPVLLAYKNKYEAKHGPVSTFGGHAYDGLMIAVAAIERAGGVDRAKVRDEIERTKGFIGTAGVFNMSPQDHMGLNAAAFKLVEVQKGAWKIIE